MRGLGAALLAASMALGVAGCANQATRGADDWPAAQAKAASLWPGERSLSDVVDDLTAGRTTAEALTRGYLARIDAIDRGLGLNSVLAVNPNAIADARARDDERRAGLVRGPLHGVPILIKDNIETRELPTTAGSLALKDNATGRDAPLVARLRAAGAVILGKTNLSEWANIRDNRSISGWSAVGGQTGNPYALDRNPCGSSSGSGAAMAATLAAATIGTETSGSIVCPASINGIVGLKPTVGLVSRTHVVPISSTMDTAGPMTLTVRDAALILSVIAGSDPADPATAEADQRRSDYVGALNAEALRGKRLGVLQLSTGGHPGVDALYTRAQADLKAAGAELVMIAPPPQLNAIGEHVLLILLAEFKATLNAYLAAAAPTVSARSLEAVIAFNRANAAREMALFGQDLFEQAQPLPGLDDPAYKTALAAARRLAGPEGLDRLLAEHRLDALIAVTEAPAWPTDPADASRSAAVDVATILPAVAGYPHLTAPMGMARGLPVGLSFIGPAWSEARLLSMGYAYEQATRRRAPPGYWRSLNETPEVRAAFAPASPR